MEEGCRFLKATPYSRKVPDVQDEDDWSSYILQIIKALRSADKANWHHRMVARVCSVVHRSCKKKTDTFEGGSHYLQE